MSHASSFSTSSYIYIYIFIAPNKLNTYMACYAEIMAVILVIQKTFDRDW